MGPSLIVYQLRIFLEHFIASGSHSLLQQNDSLRTVQVILFVITAILSLFVFRALTRESRELAKQKKAIAKGGVRL